MKKMKPILFSTPMVQAILDGRKTMTRRIAKRIPEETHRVEQISDNEFEAYWGGYVPDLKGFVDGSTIIKSPYQPGDILWVRETWFENEECLLYKASKYENAKAYHGRNGWVQIKWKPSIFMPKEAARIYLRVTGIRAERVQDITEGDALKEGVTGAPCSHVNRGVHGCEDCMNSGWIEPPQVEFMDLWDRLNKSRGYGWEVNPWVWVYEFERVDKPQEA